jgi:7,8-dihydroneopterin aldolase/epimerase/oxygenase
MNVSEALIETRPPRLAPTADGSAYLTIATGHAPRLEPLPHAMPQRCRIFIQGLRIDARIGVYDWEKAAPQPLQIDLEFGLASQLACHTDRLGDAVDYAEVVARLKELANARHYELVEAMGEAMAMTLQSEFGVPWLVLRLSKLAPFPGAEVGIVVERGKRP